MIVPMFSICLLVFAGETAPKTSSAFYPAALIERARANVQKYPWAAAIQEQIVEAAKPWLSYSDDELWDFMFGSTITRSWMVWSNGYCPACQKDVPMYTWQMDALNRPWKVRCPHCQESFPKNDFGAFYRSGLNAQGVFDPKRGDRSLLFNAEHPDPNDPKHRFGVDDGEGYVEGDKRWRFIGAYLIYGQWKGAIIQGVRNLSAAYVVTGDPVYAHKAGVLLDRVADLYPTFDFATQGVVYEQPGRAGYVSTWHDACEETRDLVLAYDAVFEGMRKDQSLVAFLAQKAKAYHLENPKATFADVQRNIEDRILRDALANRGKIYSNYPRTEITVATILTALDWLGNRASVLDLLDKTLAKATVADGVTGEKGLSGYTAFTISGIAILLAQYARLEPDLLKEILKRQPRVHQMYRFHIDTWVGQQYYPLSGDAGAFAQKSPHYVGVNFTKYPGIGPSMYTFLWDLYRSTGDAAFAQVLYHANGNAVAGLPYDLFAEDPEAVQRGVQEVIQREGAEIKLGSMNKQEWHLGILRAGEGKAARALWLDYDSGGAHGHADGMNLGLFAKGLDLLPDFGYPPVQYGGWDAPRAVWYTMTAAHNTVMVDGQNHRPASGKTTLWAEGKAFHAIRADAPALIGGKQFERTAIMIGTEEGMRGDKEEKSDPQSDIPPLTSFYVVDVFRVVGGQDHTKLFHSHFGQITTHGLSLQPNAQYPMPNAQMRGFQLDPNPKPGWSVDWKIEDRYHYLPAGTELHLRYTDLTEGAEVYLAEGWISIGGYNSSQEVWIPRVLVRRRIERVGERENGRAGEKPKAANTGVGADGGLTSTFIGVIEPYERTPFIKTIRRLTMTDKAAKELADSYAALEISLLNGDRDLVLIPNTHYPIPSAPHLYLRDSTLPVQTDAELCFVRVDQRGAIKRIGFYSGTFIQAGDLRVELRPVGGLVEIEFDNGRARILAGRDRVKVIQMRGKNVPGF